MTLLLGAGLFALGVLALFDLNFFKTKTQGVAALALGLTFIVATELMFVTSSNGGRYLEGQKIDVTDCEFQMERDYPQERRDNPRFIHEKIVGCMASLGYDWSVEHPHCAEAQIATNVFCYMPRAELQRQIVAFQMKFE
jgi:hypothetical protein